MPPALSYDRRRFLATAAATLTGMEHIMFGSTKSLLPDAGLVTNGPLSALRSATTWLNSPPLTAEALRGKVILVNFCTYTCINWLRSLPYVRAWAEKYRNHGLVVIAAHTPEFAFEKNLDNVRRAVNDLRLSYPVAVDNDYAIWRAFDNNYWPASYFIDAKGELRDRQFGEGGYDGAERTLQRLLMEAGAKNLNRDMVTVDAVGIEAEADWRNLSSPENYLGSDRTEGFAAIRGAATDKGRVYAVPTRVRLNQWALAGDWTSGRQSVALNQPNGRIVARFHARDLHLVLGPAVPGQSVRFQVRLDGQPPGAAHGNDTDDRGQGQVTQQRLYQLIRQQRPIDDRQFEIEFLDAGVEAYAFTFG